MSNTVMQLPATVSSITINSVVYNGDGSNRITVPSADVANAVKASFGARGPGITIGLFAPPTDPAT